MNELIEGIRQFRSLGCNDQVKCSLAQRVYNDLLGDEGLTNLERCYNDDLALLYITGEREGNTVAFIPVLNCQKLNLVTIGKIQDRLLNGVVSKITIAICDTSSNILYYGFNRGITSKS